LHNGEENKKIVLHLFTQTYAFMEKVNIFEVLEFKTQPMSNTRAKEKLMPAPKRPRGACSP
jgi:hypothetical protein